MFFSLWVRSVDVITMLLDWVLCFVCHIRTVCCYIQFHTVGSFIFLIFDLCYAAPGQIVNLQLAEDQKDATKVTLTFACPPEKKRNGNILTYRYSSTFSVSEVGVLTYCPLQCFGAGDGGGGLLIWSGFLRSK